MKDHYKKADNKLFSFSSIDTLSNNELQPEQRRFWLHIRPKKRGGGEGKQRKREERGGERRRGGREGKGREGKEKVKDKTCVDTLYQHS